MNAVFMEVMSDSPDKPVYKGGIEEMITIDGKWTMEGLSREDLRRVKTPEELTDYINKLGFLPLFKNEVQGFSVEEVTASDNWWSSEQEDPWSWREIIASRGEVAYGKLFCSRAGFVSREWYPYLASYRRDGYDFDSRYEEGLASSRSKKIMDVLARFELLPSNELKTAAGFGKAGERGFDSTITQLQMQTYITVRSFHRKCNKKNEEYGWSVADYCLSERLFGEEHIRAGYSLSALKVKEKIIEHIKSKFPEAELAAIEKVMK